jgi:hypothetical protein
MPEPPAELVLYYYDSGESSEVAYEIVRECGFRPSEANGSVIEMDEYTIYHYQPFEVREENVQLLDECVEQLQQNFPEMEVWLNHKHNTDYGNPVNERYQLYIAPNRDVVEDNRPDRSTRKRRSDTEENRSRELEMSSKVEWSKKGRDL